MIRQIYVSFLAFSLFFLAACGEETADVASPEGASVQTEQFSIDIPGHWEIFPESLIADKGIDFGARDPDGFGKVETVIAISSEKIPTSATLERFVSQSLENIRIHSQNFQKHHEEDMSIHGIPAKFVRYTDRNSVDLSKLHFSSIFTVVDGNAFVAVLSIDDAKSDTERDELEKILKSFHVRTSQNTTEQTAEE